MNPGSQHGPIISEIAYFLLFRIDDPDSVSPHAPQLASCLQDRVPRSSDRTEVLLRGPDAKGTTDV